MGKVLTEPRETAAEEEPNEETPETEAPEPSDPENKALFDRSQYEREELQLPKVDDEPVDRLAVKFSGTVFLDRSDPADVALVRAMRLGRDLTLMVEGKISSKAYKGATDREGDLDVVVQELGVKVGTVYRPAGAEL